MSEWDFWSRSLAGEKVETTLGTPHAGFFVAKSYFSIPYGSKRVLCDCPVAIWLDGETWRARKDDIEHVLSLIGIANADELFACCCMNPITHEKYLEMVTKLEAYRK